MGYLGLRDCVDDLEQSGRLIRIDTEIDPNLEAAEIHRRVFRNGGPAVLFARVKGCEFPMVSNLFGTQERVHYIFRDTLPAVRRLIELKISPDELWRRPFRSLRTARRAWHMLPRRCASGPVLARQTSIDRLPQLRCWPDDGGAFITLPVVYSEDVEQPGMRKSNLGMYRVQLSGGRYQPNAQVGLHYQIHRGIGVQHAAAIRQGQPLRVNIFVGGSPAMSVAAVMPLPEGLSELSFAGALAGHRIRMVTRDGGLPVYADADFCITGTIDSDVGLPEGPFGDHLGYYSLRHDFPVLRVDRVYHREGAIWPFTVVGRPPQEDTMFGELIHELTGPVIPTVVPGVHQVHAVDAAGVHPLMLAVGSERYVPYQQPRQPREVLTQANAILGQGQMSLAKYLLIVAKDDNPQLNIHDIPAFLAHLLERVDWRRDLHFQTRTTIDTLDYSGSGLNEGSKVVVAAVGPRQRDLPSDASDNLGLPDGFHSPAICLPGIVAIAAPPYTGNQPDCDRAVQRFCQGYDAQAAINRFPLIVLVDDSSFTAQSLGNFLWVTFTRSNPAADIDGIEASVDQKHWGCRGALVIDARIKPHHAPPLIEDPEITRKVDSLAASGMPISRYL